MFRVKRTCENVWRRSFYVQIDHVSGYRGKTLKKHRTKPDKTKSEFEKTNRNRSTMASVGAEPGRVTTVDKSPFWKLRGVWGKVYGLAQHLNIVLKAFL